MNEKHDELDQLERRVLQSARVGMSPEGARRNDLLTQLRSGLTNQTSQTIHSPSTAPIEPTFATGRVFSLANMVFGVLVAGTIGFGAGYFTGGKRANSQAQPVRTIPVESDSPRKGGDVTGPFANNEDGALSVAELSTDSKSDPKQVRGTHPTPPASSAKSEKTQAKLTFYNELAYIRRAQSALQKGDGALALGLMESLDGVERNGALLAERNVTKVLALCLLDRVEEASQVGRRTLQSSAADVYRRRLDSSCVASRLSEPFASEGSGPETVEKDPGQGDRQ